MNHVIEIAAYDISPATAPQIPLTNEFLSLVIFFPTGIIETLYGLSPRPSFRASSVCDLLGVTTS